MNPPTGPLNPFSEPLKAVIKNLIENGLVNNQKELAKRIDFDETSVSRAKHPKDKSIVATAAKIALKIVEIFGNEEIEGFAELKALLGEERIEAAAKVEEKQNSFPYVGKYNVFWKKIIDFPLIIEASLEIFDGDRAIFDLDDENIEGFIHYLSGKLFISFYSLNEEFYFIFDIGSTTSKTLIASVPGIILAVEGRLQFIYSAYCLLQKQEAASMAATDAFFNYIGSNFSIEVNRKLSLLLDPRIIKNEDNKKNIHPLVGKWNQIGLTSKKNIRIGKIEIFNNGEVDFKGVIFSNYKGNVEIKNGDVYIYLRNDARNAMLVAALAPNDISKVELMIMGYSTADPHIRGTSAGTVCLIKEGSARYQDTLSGEYAPGTEIYEHYSEIIEKLETYDFENYVE